MARLISFGDALPGDRRTDDVGEQERDRSGRETAAAAAAAAPPIEELGTPRWEARTA